MQDLRSALERSNERAAERTSALMERFDKVEKAQFALEKEHLRLQLLHSLQLVRPPHPRRGRDLHLGHGSLDQVHRLLP